MSPAMRMVEVCCPACNTVLDAATDLSGLKHAPKPGDVTVCFYCAAMLTFDQPPAMHVMTDPELAALSEDEYDTLLVVQHAVRVRPR